MDLGFVHHEVADVSLIHLQSILISVLGLCRGCRARVTNTLSCIRSDCYNRNYENPSKSNVWALPRAPPSLTSKSKSKSVISADIARGDRTAISLFATIAKFERE